MSTTDILEVAGLILTTIGMIAKREWLIKQIKNLARVFQNALRYIWFRSFLLLVVVFVTLYFLFKENTVDSGFVIGFVAISLLWFVGENFIVFPLIQELSKTQTELNELKIKIDILNQAKKIELENVKQKWHEFVDSLIEKPGYQVVGAFLKLSNPVHIENDVLLLSIPEVVFNASSNFSLEGITPLLRSFYGVEYKLKLSVIES
jgi:FlaA1/EpsC-like NDP-sugar epimerase